MRRTTLSPGPRSWRRGASARGAVLSAAVLAALAVGAPGQQKQQFAELFKQTFPDNRDRSESIAIGDVDGDGDLDMVVATRAQNRLYLNDGEGNYTDATAAKLPVSTDWTTEVVLGDVDGDGDLDMVLATYYWSTNYSGQNRLLLNDGSGGFTDVSAQQMPLLNDPTVDAALGDVDGDGDLDIVFGNAGYPGWQNRLYLNNGFGVFTDATATNLPPRGFVTLAVAFGDVDGDGDPDLIEGNFFAQSRIYLNNGAGVYADATATNFPVYSSAVADVVVGDVDGDGDQDLILAQYSNLFGNNLNLLYLNNGAGVFTDVTATQMPNLSEWTESVALGDVDGDGDLDLVCGNDYADDRLYVNNGAGFFTDATAAQMPPAHGDAQTVALGDVDGDGDLDMVIGNFTNKYATPSRLYLNDGGGKFVQTVVHRLPENVSRTTALAFGDVDGDGDLDIAVGTAATRCKYGCGGDQNQLYLNDGRGQFTDVTAGQLPSYYDETNALAFADVDGDGDLDMVVANDSGCRLLVNDGAGNFTEVTTTQLPASWQIASCVVLGDVDGDGDIDMVVGSTQGNYWYYTYGTGQTRLYVNDGRGFFRDATLTHMPLDRDDTRAVTLGDIDGDGDLDLVLGSGASYA
ncbi:MAG: VCBS repeat-containing protein, partial [Planctomycetes bacterium]|nr:VCBS repeat-containing protein [Planctomycetota bacterium]